MPQTAISKRQLAASAGQQAAPTRVPTLRLSLLRSIALVLLITLFFGGVLTYVQALKKIETEMTSAIAIAEKTVRKALPEIERDDDPRQELVRLVRVFDGNRHVRATLSDDRPAERWVRSAPALAQDLPDWFHALFARAPLSVKIEIPAKLGGFEAMTLETESTAEIAEVWNEVMLKLAILMVFCLALGALVYVTLGRALAPLTDLTEAFERIGNADYSARVAELGPAELSNLCAGFNVMAKRLGDFEQRNAQLNDQLATVQEEERADLARDLHDEVSPFLFSVDVDAASIRQLAGSHDADLIQARAEEIRRSVAHMKKHVRSILGRLRPAAHLELGLADAIESLAASWRLRNPGLVFRTDVKESYGQKLDTVIHGLVREAVSNALRHGKATEITIAIGEDEHGEIDVLVSDNGRGIGEGQPAGGFGLIAMRERVAALGGSVIIANKTGASGVDVKARIPTPQRQDQVPSSET